MNGDSASGSEQGDPCPVCGWAVIRTEGVPEPTDGSRPYGMLYVHELLSKGRAGHFSVSGCTVYNNGETDAWTPDGRDKHEVEA